MTTPGPQTFGEPVPIGSGQNLAGFDSGEPLVDDWLKRRALKNEKSGASRTFAVTAGETVAGYYSLAAGALEQEEAPGKVQRNMPKPIPVILLGRLAVDRTWQGHGLGSSLLRDALLRCVKAARHIGARLVLVHAIPEPARQFYLRYRFTPSLVKPMALMLLLDEVDALLQD